METFEYIIKWKTGGRDAHEIDAESMPDALLRVHHKVYENPAYIDEIAEVNVKLLAPRENRGLLTSESLTQRNAKQGRGIQAPRRRGALSKELQADLAPFAESVLKYVTRESRGSIAEGRLSGLTDEEIIEVMAAGWITKNAQG